MTKKLKRKIGLLALSAIFFFLALILSIVNIVTWANISSSGDELTLTLLERGGRFDGDGGVFDPSEEPPSGDPGLGSGQQGGPKFADEDTRYFVVVFADDGSVVTTDTMHIAKISAEEANELAKAHRKAGDVGFSGDYRYRYSLDGKVAVFVDMSRQTSPAFTFLWTSLGVMGGGLVVSALLMPLLTKWMVGPLEESIKKQKRFIADASHELKTPLSIISANNEIEELEKGESESTRTIAHQIVKMSEMIRALNAMAKLDEVREDISLVALDLSAIAKKVADSFTDAFQLKGIEFTSEIEEGLSCRGDASLLEKLFSVILDNAYKYSLSKATFSLKKEGERISLVCVNDANMESEGPIDEVFDRFYRSANARAGQSDGSGIGLSLAKEIIAIHEGRIHAYAEKGTFRIEARL